MIIFRDFLIFRIRLNITDKHTQMLGRLAEKAIVIINIANIAKTMNVAPEVSSYAILFSCSAFCCCTYARTPPNLFGKA